MAPKCSAPRRGHDSQIADNACPLHSAVLRKKAVLPPPIPWWKIVRDSEAAVLALALHPNKIGG